MNILDVRKIRKVPITGIARPLQSTFRRLGFFHPGGRDGRITFREALKDEGRAARMAQAIARAKAAHPSDQRAQAFEVMLILDPALSPDSPLIRPFERLYRQALETQPTTHDAAAWLLGKLTVKKW
jgi:hypothetical protein